MIKQKQTEYKLYTMEGWTGADTFYSNLTLGVINKLRSLQGIQVIQI